MLLIDKISGGCHLSSSQMRYMSAFFSRVLSDE